MKLLKVLVFITDVLEGVIFSGVVVDGYISGAEIFIDQNFNFKLDPTEYWN